MGIKFLAVTDSSANADKASTYSAAHSFFERNLRLYAVFPCDLNNFFEHYGRTAGVDNIRLFLCDLFLERIGNEAFSSCRAVVGAEDSLCARLGKIILKNNSGGVSETAYYLGICAEVFSNRNHRRISYAAADNYSLVIAVKLESVSAERSDNVN